MYVIRQLYFIFQQTTENFLKRSLIQTQVSYFKNLTTAVDMIMIVQHC